MEKKNANCVVERDLPFLSYSYLWKTATGRDDKRGADSSGWRLKGNNLDTAVGGIQVCVNMQKKKRKGRDLLKDRPRLESAQTVAATAAAAVKHAFFYHSKISPDSRVLSPSTLSPTVGGKKKKNKTARCIAVDRSEQKMVERERQAGANATAELPFCNLLMHTSQKHAFIFHLCPHYTTLCVCVCPHMLACVFRQASGLHRGFCTSCVGHVEEDVSRGQELAAGEEGGSPAGCVKVQILGAALAHCSDRLGECEFWQGREETKNKGSMCASIKSDKHISTLATMKTPPPTLPHTSAELPSADSCSPESVVRTRHPCGVLSFVAEQSLTPPAGIWF